MEKKKKNVFKTVIKWVLLVFTVLASVFFLFTCATLLKMDAWDSFDPDKILGAAETSIFYDDENREIFRLHGAEDRISITLDTLPSYVPEAFVSAEDARFYEHKGIDLIRIAGAAWEDIKAGGYVQGASTISQQLIKLSHLNAEKTMSRKLEEAVLAYNMEKNFSKDEILTMYLNYVYFGGGYYGVEAASQGYFGKHASELTLAQAALLAGILKAPSNYAPHLNAEASVKRRNLILGLMCDYGYISEEDRDAARKEELVLYDRSLSGSRMNYYLETAIREASAILGLEKEELYTGGYRIYTAMDRDLQEKCEAVLSDGAYFPADDVQTAIVMQYTNSRLIPALVGGRHTQSYNFNRATDIRRQPGSVIKPVICYAPALESKKYTAATVLFDEKTVFGDYSPDNFGSKYYGWVTMREAVTRSLNIPAVQVLSDLGVENAKKFAQSLGISFDETDNSLTLALGGFTYGVSPWMITGAYNCFASGGVYYQPTVIREIRNEKGEVLYTYEREGSRVMSEQNAYILTSMLESVVSEGTGHRLGELGIQLAGKTGTVGENEGNRDAWMAAYNPAYTTSVWMGYDSSADGSLPKAATGGKYPALILYEIYSYLYNESEAPLFECPEGVIEERLDTHSLKYEHTAALATAFTPHSSVYTEVFAEGTQPSHASSYWVVPLPPANFSVSKNAKGYPVIRFDPREDYVQYKIYRTDEYGTETCIADFDGSKTAEYTDTAVLAGNTYSYYALSVHPEMSVNGKQAQSAKTIALEVEVSALLYGDTGYTDNGAKASDGVIDLSALRNRFS